MTGPLSGVRVVEITNVVAGPSTGVQLADQGADVIKVESPTGDIIRASAKSGLPPMFISCNRGKRSISVDLKQDAAKENTLGINRESRCFYRKHEARCPR